MCTFCSFILFCVKTQHFQKSKSQEIGKFVCLSDKHIENLLYLDYFITKYVLNITKKVCTPIFKKLSGKCDF